MISLGLENELQNMLGICSLWNSGWFLWDHTLKAKLRIFTHRNEFFNCPFYSLYHIASLLQCLITASLDFHGKTDQRKASIRNEVTQKEKGKFNCGRECGLLSSNLFSLFYLLYLWFWGVSLGEWFSPLTVMCRKKRFFVYCFALFEVQQYIKQVAAKSPWEGWVYIGNRLKVGGYREGVEADRSACGVFQTQQQVLQVLRLVISLFSERSLRLFVDKTNIFNWNS